MSKLLEEIIAYATKDYHEAGIYNYDDDCVISVRDLKKFFEERSKNDN